MARTHSPPLRSGRDRNGWLRWLVSIHQRINLNLPPPTPFLLSSTPSNKAPTTTHRPPTSRQEHNPRNITARLHARQQQHQPSPRFLHPRPTAPSSYTQLEILFKVIPKNQLNSTTLIPGEDPTAHKHRRKTSRIEARQQVHGLQAMLANAPPPCRRTGGGGVRYGDGKVEKSRWVSSGHGGRL